MADEEALHYLPLHPPDKLIERVPTAILRCWNACALAINLVNCARLHAAHELASRIAQACGLGVPHDSIQQVIAGAEAYRKRQG